MLSRYQSQQSNGETTLWNRTQDPQRANGVCLMADR